MNQDTEHLRLLSIFHYIMAGLAALFSFFPLLYAGMGALFIWASQHPNPKQTGEPPPEFLGWIFIGLGSVFFLLGMAMATCILMVGRSLDQRTRYWFAFIVACIERIFIPFGTILGVFTIIMLSRDSVKTLFSGMTLSGPA